MSKEISRQSATRGPRGGGESILRSSTTEVSACPAGVRDTPAG
jgi:hypothetical protein